MKQTSLNKESSSFIKNRLIRPNIIILILSVTTITTIYLLSNKSETAYLKIILYIQIFFCLFWFFKNDLLRKRGNNKTTLVKNRFLKKKSLKQQLKTKSKDFDTLKEIFQKNQIQFKEQFSYIQNNCIRLQNENHQIKIKLHQILEESQKKDIVIKFLKQEQKESKENHEGILKELKQENENILSLLKEHRITQKEQRGIINQKSSYILKLENKIRDLITEIKNLLTIDLPKTPASHQGTDILKVLTEKAENLEFGNDFRYDVHTFCIPPNQYSPNIREFFDILRNENSFILFVYSLKEKNCIFSNSLFKTWIGFSHNVFFKKKHDFLLDNGNEWIKDIECSQSKENIGKVSIKTALQKRTDFYYCNRKIRKGPLNEHTIGILTLQEK
ncbi:MAG: hypothetical protein RRZ67_01600 [Victivallaceae bacterium]